MKSNYSEEQIDELKEKVKSSNGVITPQSYFVQIPNCFARNNKFSTDVRYMYIYLLGFGGETKQMYPSHARIMKDLGWGKQKIIKVLKALEDCGGVYIINRKFSNSNKKSTNLYCLSQLDNNTGDFVESSLEMIKETFPDKIFYI